MVYVSHMFGNRELMPNSMNFKEKQIFYSWELAFPEILDFEIRQTGECLSQHRTDRPRPSDFTGFGGHHRAASRRLSYLPIRSSVMLWPDLGSVTVSSPSLTLYVYRRSCLSACRIRRSPSVCQVPL